MLLLRSFPLSFAILWRFIVILPFLILMLAVYVVLTVFWGLFAAAFSWLFTLVMILGMTFVMQMIPLLIGMRLGLQARGENVTNTYADLFWPSMGYGAFEAMIKLILTTIAVLAFVGLSSSVSFSNLMSVFAGGPEAYTALNDPRNAGLIGFVTICTALMFAVLRALMLPVLAAASCGRDPNGDMHTPFFGFGASFFWLLLLLILSYVINVAIWPAAIALAYALGWGDDLAMMAIQLQRMSDGSIPWHAGLQEIGIIMGVVVFYIWLFSLLCAGGTLSFIRRREAYDIKEAEEPEVARMDPDELRDMIRSRMPERKY